MIPVRLVLDTNVFVSAALKPDGLQRTVTTVALTRPARLYVSAPILREYQEVLSRRELGISRGDRQRLLELVRKRAQIVIPLRRLQISMDASDNMFLECAEAARADYLVTGNQQHFPRFWKATKIITPREFIILAAPHLVP
jgi:putative PIN family toxin of toxin-antitoxin system